jgi:hypothetical protein
MRDTTLTIVSIKKKSIVKDGFLTKKAVSRMARSLEFDSCQITFT